MREFISEEKEIDIDYVRVEEAICELGKYQGLNAMLEWKESDFHSIYKLVVKYKRAETDEEYSARQAIEYKEMEQKAKKKEKRVEADRKRYEALKKRFG